MSYKVVFTPQAIENISKLDKTVAERIIRKIDWLSQNYGIINPLPLKGQFQGLFKLVVGDWRVLYTADFAEKAIVIHLIGHRSEIYKT